MKRSQLLALAAVAGFVFQSSATIFFNDNFAQFESGNLVGQNGWAQLGTPTTLPLQVTGGEVVMPSVTSDGQDTWRSFGTQVVAPESGSQSFYVALTLTVDQSTPAGKNPSYFFGMSTNQLDATGFVNFRLSTTNDLASGPDNFRFLGRVTGQSGSPWSIGSVLTHGLQYTLLVEGNLNSGAQNDTLRLFVNPTGNDLSLLTPDLVATLTPGGNGTDPTGIGNVILSQFGSSTTTGTGIRFGQIVAGDDFTEVMAAVPEPSSLTLALGGGLLLLIRRMRRG